MISTQGMHTPGFPVQSEPTSPAQSSSTHSSHSETQLRSRLKKWRVTKPSRQTRKKTQGSEDPESEKESRTSSSSPRTSRASPAARKTPSAPSSAYRHDWTAHSAYGPVELSQPKWNAHMGPHLTTPSPSADHHSIISDSHSNRYPLTDPNAPVTSFEQTSTHTSPAAEHVILNTTTAAATPSYAAYSLSPESCGPSPEASSTSVMAQWPARPVSGDIHYQPALHPTQWYNLPLEPLGSPSVGPHSAAPLTTPAQSTGYAMYPGHNVYSPGYMHYDHSEYHQGYDLKQWKQVPSRPHEYTGYANRSALDRKHGYPHGGPPSEMLPITASQAGPQTVMCAPMVPYSG